MGDLARNMLQPSLMSQALCYFDKHISSCKDSLSQSLELIMSIICLEFELVVQHTRYMQLSFSAEGVGQSQQSSDSIPPAFILQGRLTMGPALSLGSVPVIRSSCQQATAAHLAGSSAPS